MFRTLMWLATTSLAVACAAAATTAAAQERGGILNFAIVAEPPSYDCHANTTFGVLHPVAPHYSTLLKYTGDWREMRIEPDVAEVLVVHARWADLHLQAAAEREVPRRLAHDICRREGHLRPHHQSARKASCPRAARSMRTSPPSRRPILSRSSSASRRPTPRRSTASPRPGTASTAPPSSRKTRAIPKPRSWAPAPSASSSTSRARAGKASASRAISSPASPTSTASRRSSSNPAALATGIIGGQFDIEFRGLTPADRDQIVDKLKDNAVVLEGPWSASLMLTINARKKPFDDIRVRQALTHRHRSLGRRAGHGPHLADEVRRRLHAARLRARAQRCRAREASRLRPRHRQGARGGQAPAQGSRRRRSQDQLPQPQRRPALHGRRHLSSIDQWSRIGVETEHKQLETKLFYDALARGDFDVAIDFITDHGDDPNLQYMHVVSRPCSRRCPIRSTATRRSTSCSRRQKRALDPAERKQLDPGVRAVLDHPGLQHACCSGGSASSCTTSGSRAGS